MNIIFEDMGFWKLPRHENFIRSGTISYFPEKGIRLEILNPFAEDYNEHKEEHEIIHGFTRRGKRITLVESNGSSSSSIPGIRTTNYSSRFLITGHWFNKKKEILFDKVTLQLHNFTEWVNISGFTFNRDTSDPYKSTLEYKYPENIKLYKDDEIEIYVTFKLTRTPSFSIKKREFEQIALLNIRYTKLTPLEYILKKVNLMIGFISIGLSSITRINSFELTNSSILNHMETPIVNHLIFTSDILTSKVLNDVDPKSMLFNFDDIQENREFILDKWIKKFNLLSPVVDLYIDTVYKTKIYAKQRFLNTIFAIETLHRRLSNKTDLPVEDHEKRVSAILENTPKEYKEWLKGKLAYSNELNLRSRIKEILEIHSDVITSFLPAKKSKFIFKVMNTRNYLVHHSSGLEKNIIREENMYKYNLALIIILKTMMLDFIGIQSDKFELMLNRPSLHRFLKNEVNKK